MGKALRPSQTPLRRGAPIRDQTARADTAANRWGKRWVEKISSDYGTHGCDHMRRATTPHSGKLADANSTTSRDPLLGWGN